MSGSALAAVHAYLASLDGAPGGGGATAGVPQPPVSRAVRRQRSWALREAVLFAAVCNVRDVTSGVPLSEGERGAAQAGVGRVDLRGLFAPDFVDTWLTYADAVLRGVDPPSTATRRARMTSLRALAAFIGTEIPAHRDPKPLLRAVLSEPEIASALRALTQRLPGRGPDDHVRLAAILSVMSVWPVRSVELCSLRLAQVRDRGADVLLDVLAEGAGEHGETGPLVLHGIAAERVRHWIAVRESLVSALSGGPVHSFWTSIRSNSRPGASGRSLPLPPGMPLKPRGMQRAYARSVEAANLLHHGLPGFPLPRSLDLLRRSLLEAASR